MNYKERIAHHLRSCLDKGMTHAELARGLGFNTGNLVTMHLQPTNPVSPFPLKRIPALARHCGLSDQEALALIQARAVDHPDSPTEIDQPTFKFMLRCGIASMDAHRAVAGA